MSKKSEKKKVASMSDNSPEVDENALGKAPDEKAAKKEPTLNARDEIGELAKTIAVAIILALFIRTFVYEPFNIPSGSMKPTLEVGDYLFVYKPSYGYSRYSFPYGMAPIKDRVMSATPKRGDVVVFKLPTNTNIDYIKRVVALPGETVQVRQGRLYINGRMVPREAVGLKEVDDQFRGKVMMMEYIETLPGNVLHRIYEEADDKPLDNTDVYIVPEGHYFAMGDNRDNSQDSRVLNQVGYIPFENFVGRADVLFFSTNGYAKLLEIWKWPWSIRYSRLFTNLNPVRPDGADASDEQVSAVPNILNDL